MRISASRSINEPSPKTPYAVIYDRVSFKDQEEGFSIDSQFGLLRGYAPPADTTGSDVQPD